MTGWIKVTRDLIDHPYVGIANPKRFAAWMWMLAQARYEDGEIEVGGAPVALLRGQFSHSLRHISKETGMTFQQVRTFLDGLESRKMCTKTNTPGKTGQSIITICNYSKYQDGEARSAKPDNTAITQQQHSDNTINKKGINKEVIDDDTREVSSEFFDDVCEAAGVDLSKTVSTYWHGGQAQSHIRTWRNLGLTADEVLTCIRAVVANKRDGPPKSLSYFDRALSDAAGAKARPDLSPTNGASHERPRTAQERAAANHSDVTSAWLAEGRRRDEERGLGDGAQHSGDPGEGRMDSGQASNAVVSLFPAGPGHDGFGGGGFGLDEHPRQVSASGYRDGL